MPTQNQPSELPYDTPTVPPGTPPVINDRSAPAEGGKTMPDGDSDFPGNTPDEEVHPGGDTVDPSTGPEELPPGEETIDKPSQTPDETPPPA